MLRLVLRVLGKVDERRVDERAQLTGGIVADTMGEHLKGDEGRVGLDDDEEGSLAQLHDLLRVHVDRRQDRNHLTPTAARLKGVNIYLTKF